MFGLHRFFKKKISRLDTYHIWSFQNYLKPKYLDNNSQSFQPLLSMFSVYVAFIKKHVDFDNTHYLK